MPGTIYRMLDDRSLQRGITYTIMPDGKSLRVPAMSKLDVRASAESHQDNEQGSIVQALSDILKGKKPVEGRARFNRKGRARRVPTTKAPMQGGDAGRHSHDGVRKAEFHVGGYQDQEARI
jgi:hypothetical protein